MTWPQSSTSIHTYLWEFLVPENGSFDFGTACDQTKERFSKCLRCSVKPLGEEIICDTFSRRSFIGEPQAVISLRWQKPSIVTLNLEVPVQPHSESFFNLDTARVIETELRKSFNATRSKVLPPLKRGGPVDPYRYLNASDDRLLEYDVEEVLADVQSPFQKVEILKTKNFGNLLVLDGLQNLAESDIVYTETLMHRGTIDYMNKDVLILGGGDGALLWELLKEKPSFVTMVDIDDVVMQLCKKHMRSACGTALDTYDGPNYKIIVDDCMKILKSYIDDKKEFDYVFGDLTDIPVSDAPIGQIWDFMKSVLALSLQVLKKDGKFLMHGNGVSSEPALQMFEAQLAKLQVSFSRSNAFVPSFMEDWVFYQIWKTNSEVHQNGLPE
ncbi:spermine synthase-like isoform X2 [Artemia franciscana]|uniref:PABS domain-containing protein n=1 Tax=Artemia franciscana TaxID=6661 RepID=A0AA88HW81_ARTSF|nr:hypothetical protein QYM36_009969 [Artemia franciscana]